jgi:hypothetical protein
MFCRDFRLYNALSFKRQLQDEALKLVILVAKSDNEAPPVEVYINAIYAGDVKK